MDFGKIYFIHNRAISICKAFDFFYLVKHSSQTIEKNPVNIIAHISLRRMGMCYAERKDKVSL